MNYTLLILAIILAIYILTIGIIIYGFFRLTIANENSCKKPLQKISVLIPVRSEAINIINCLDSLERQIFDKHNFEVIIIDDHSSDNTMDLVNNFKKTTSIEIVATVLANKTTKKEALRKGVSIAKYDIIATTDADCILPKNWLQNISNEFFEETKMLLGPVIFKHEKGILGVFQQLDMFAIQGVSFGLNYFKQPILNNAANLSYSKMAYDNVDGYDNNNTPSGDDIFLLEKFKTQNHSVKGLLKSDFVVETVSATSLKEFINQRMRWASKSKFYKDKLLQFISGLILFSNLAVLFIYLELLFVEEIRTECLILLISKLLIDFILLFLVSSFFKKKKLLYYFIFVELIYPVYIVLIGIFSKVYKFEWKGRKFNG